MSLWDASLGARQTPTQSPDSSLGSSGQGRGTGQQLLTRGSGPGRPLTGPSAASSLPLALSGSSGASAWGRWLFPTDKDRLGACMLGYACVPPLLTARRTAVTIARSVGASAQLQACNVLELTREEGCSWTRSNLSAGSKPTPGNRQPRGSDQQFLLPTVPWNDWQIREEDIVIDKRPDGSDWQLGSGAFGKARTTRSWPAACLAQASRWRMQ